MRGFWKTACTIVLACILGGSATAQEVLFQSKRITQQSSFGRNIEGPSVDAAGNLYIPNFGANGKIGKMAPGATELEPFADLNPTPPPEKISIGNGTRFDREGRMYIADFNRHNIFVILAGERKPRPYFSPGANQPKFNQPNDLAIAADGTLYASDPLMRPPTGTPKFGQIWRITRGSDDKGHGEVMTTTRPGRMGTTNGLDLSPDGKTLYVSESSTRQLWSYRLDGNKLVDHKMIHQFGMNPAEDVDGLRTDVDGRIFLARPAGRKITIVTIIPATPGNPQRAELRDVPTVGIGPTNLTFGGPDGKTVFVTQTEDGGFIESFRTDRPGREPCMQVPSKC